MCTRVLVHVLLLPKHPQIVQSGTQNWKSLRVKIFSDIFADFIFVFCLYKYFEAKKLHWWVGENIGQLRAYLLRWTCSICVLYFEHKIWHFYNLRICVYILKQSIFSKLFAGLKKLTNAICDEYELCAFVDLLRHNLICPAPCSCDLFCSELAIARFDKSPACPRSDLPSLLINKEGFLWSQVNISISDPWNQLVSHDFTIMIHTQVLK